MTKSSPVVLAYHGCDAWLGEKALIAGIDLEPSNKSYDWLGPGVYFWQNDPIRAWEWADAKVKSGGYRTAFVVGAAIDLGNCLDLTLRENIELLVPAYKGRKALNKATGLPMPRNRDPRAKTRGDKLLRYRDCAVIRHLHEIIADPITNRLGEPDYIEPFDTVRGMFFEGHPAYPGGGFYARSHIQLAVISPKSIIGVFKPKRPV